jgi:tRNA A37 methylthiotransferase MiaB
VIVTDAIVWFGLGWVGLASDVGLSSDFISGFCGETEEQHQDTLSLLREVRFDQAFMFAYSMREKTNAHRALQYSRPFL